MDDATEVRKLFDRAREGDEDAARSLYERWSPAARSALAKDLKGNRAGRLLRPSDVIQSVFLNLLCRADIDEFQIQNFDSYFRRSVKNKLREKIDMLQAEKRDVRRNVSTPFGDVKLPVGEGDPCDSLVVREEFERIISSLADGDRVILITYLNEGSYSKAAQVLEMSDDRIRYTVQEIIKRLRERFNPG